MPQFMIGRSKYALSRLCRFTFLSSIHNNIGRNSFDISIIETCIYVSGMILIGNLGLVAAVHPFERIVRTVEVVVQRRVIVA